MTTEHTCIHENTLNEQNIEIAQLKTRIEYKHERIDELKTSLNELSKKLDKIDHCLNELKLQSERDDFNIDNRVTQLETTQNTLKWIIGVGLTCVGTAIAILTFFLTILH